MPAPIQLYVEHEELPYEDDMVEGNHIAKLCVGAFTVLQVKYWAYEDSEQDEHAAEVIANVLKEKLK